jgi:hypothetical protein
VAAPRLGSARTTDAMLDTDRQLPAISASVWVINLAAIDGPQFVVLSRDEAEAREALVVHLVEIGAIANTIEAFRIVNAAGITALGVVW